MSNCRFRKRIMSYGNSLSALQWISWMEQKCPDLVNSEGERVPVQHQYFRGEMEYANFTIDGYALVDSKHVFFEFLGDAWHAGCEQCQTNPGVDDTWIRKKKILQQAGTLHYIRECEWTRTCKTLKKYETPSLPMIMNRSGTEMDILDGIKSATLYGFIVADITTPVEVYEKIKWINFPPIFQRAFVTEDMLSPYMKTRVEHEGTKLPRETVIQTYNAKQQLLYTDLVRFYIDLGLVISNITMFVQFTPSKPLKPFVDRVTEGRMNATRDGNDNLGLAFKITGNAGFGKTGEDVQKYTKTYYGDDKKLKRLHKSALYEQHHTLTTEDGDYDLIEITMKPRKITDNKPILMAVKILQDSKLHFLKFIYNVLFKYMRPGSLKLNYCDTDSIAMCKLCHTKKQLV